MDVAIKAKQATKSTNDLISFQFKVFLGLLKLFLFMNRCATGRMLKAMRSE